MELEQNEVIEQDTTGGETSEETNQDGFLDAFNETEEVEEAKENEESEDNEDVGESEDAPPQADEQRHRIRVDHQDVDLTLDELKVHAQKGMAFDRLKESYDALKASTDRLHALAEKQKISFDQLVEQAEEGLKSAEFETLKSKYLEAGYDEEIAETLANKDIEIATAKQTQLANLSDQEIKQQRDVQLFNELYPEVVAKDIPDEVFGNMNQYGMSLVEAYQHYKMQQLKAQAAVKELNAKNASNAVGSARDSKRTQKKDDFLSEFMKE